jgi:hypothetical protein
VPPGDAGDGGDSDSLVIEGEEGGEEGAGGDKAKETESGGDAEARRKKAERENKVGGQATG